MKYYSSLYAIWKEDEKGNRWFMYKSHICVDFQASRKWSSWTYDWIHPSKDFEEITKEEAFLEIL